VTRDIFDVLESVTLKYDDGRVEHPDFFKVITFHVFYLNDESYSRKQMQKGCLGAMTEGNLIGSIMKILQVRGLSSHGVQDKVLRL
jgi:hypothetical protein